MITVRKTLALVILLVAGATVGLAAYALHDADIEELVICSTSDSASLIPRPVCRWYTEHYRITKEEAQILDGRSGLAFLFSVDDTPLRDHWIKRFINEGASVNGPSPTDGLPPLHAAILMNEPDLVALLLEHGADLQQRASAWQLDPLAFARRLVENDPSIDRSQVLSLLDAGAG